MTRASARMAPVPVPAMTSIPATPAAWAEDEGARKAFRWPMRFAQIIEPMAGVYRDYVAATLAEADDDLRRVLLLGRRAMPVLALVQFALLTQAAKRDNTRLVGHPLLDYLANGGDGEPAPLQPIGQPRVGGRWRMPRRLARTRSWTSLARLPRAMLVPDGVALTHNSLLRTWLRDAPVAVCNAYDEDFDLPAGRTKGVLPREVDAIDLATEMRRALTADLKLDDDVSDRLGAALDAVLTESYGDAADLLARLRAARRLPKALYSGTGNKRMSRALGLEIMRRGGEVTRCDHGGSFALLHPPDYVALNELSVSTRYLMPTRYAAKAPEMQAAAQRAAPLSGCVLEGATGDPGLDVGPAAFRRSPNPDGKPRVMYVSTVFYGMFQASPPVLAGPLYLDWQRRFIEILKSLPISLTCKPHPGGWRPPAALDPASGVSVATAPFERAVADADVLVYDFPATTTLAVGLCTDRPVILVDHGTMRFNPSMEAAVAARCQIVSTGYDDDNRLTVARDALETAILNAPAMADPTHFRSLYLGERAA